MIKNILRVSVRKALRQKTYTAINVVGVSLSMACSALILLYVLDEYSYDTFHEHAERIFRVVDGASAQTPIPLGPMLYRERPEVQGYTRVTPSTGVWALRYKDRTFYEQSVFLADATVFEVFTFPLIRGNAETALVDPLSVVLSQAMAQKYFGEADPIGKTLIADNGIAHLTVTGVMQNLPANAHFHADFLVASTLRERLTDWNFEEDWYGLGGRTYTYLMLQEGYPVERLEVALPTLLRTHVDTETQNGGVTFDLALQPLTDIHLHSHLEQELQANGDAIYVALLIAIACFLVLIACFNMMNLATAQTKRLAREVCIRKVVGAQRRDLMLHVLADVLVVMLVASGCAVLLVWMALPGFNALAGKALVVGGAHSGAFAMIMLVMLVGTTLLASGYPAFALSAFRPVDLLTGSMPLGRRPGRVRRVLVCVQFTLGIGLIIGTGTLFKQLTYVQQKRLGLQTEQVVLLPSGLAEVMAKYEPLKDALLQQPDVMGVTAASFIPGHAVGARRLLRLPVQPNGTLSQATHEVPVLYYDYQFEQTLGIELAAGRFFSSDFALDRNREALLLNEYAARQLGWITPEAALGQQLDVGSWFKGTVVGVVKDFHTQSLHHPIEPIVLMLIHGNGSYVSHIALRIRPEAPSATLAAVSETWETFFPELPFGYTFLDEEFAQWYRVEERLQGVYSVFTVIALFIAFLGLLGLATFTAEQRTKEIGIRKVLGASARHVVQLLVREYVVLIVLANSFAWPLTYIVIQQWLETFAYHIEVPWELFGLAGGAVLVIAVLAVGYQALSRSLINPIAALRHEA